MKTPEQLKGAIRNMAKSKGIHAQEVLQMFMFERIIERLSISPYKEIFILKGGLLISSMLGIAERTTLDMDTTVKGFLMEEHKVREAIISILNQPIPDGVHFQFIELSPIREDDEYRNFRASLQAVYGKMNIPLKIDITTGDKITPREIQYSYPFLFEDRTVSIMAYTTETILAEKYETIIRRNVSNTRMRDFYDLYILFLFYQEHPNWKLLKQAVTATAVKRDSLKTLQDTSRILTVMEASASLQNLWDRYQATNLYAKNITYPAIIETIRMFAAQITI